MFFAEMSAEGWTIVVGAIALGVGQVVTLFLTYFSNLRKAERDVVAAEHLAEVKNQSTANAEKIDHVQATQATKGQVETVRVMLNGEKTAMKQTNAALARELANDKPTPENLARAELAERNLAIHEAQLAEKPH